MVLEDWIWPPLGYIPPLIWSRWRWWRRVLQQKRPASVPGCASSPGLNAWERRPNQRLRAPNETTKTDSDAIHSFAGLCSQRPPHLVQNHSQEYNHLHRHLPRRRSRTESKSIGCMQSKAKAVYLRFSCPADDEQSSAGVQHMWGQQWSVPAACITRPTVAVMFTPFRPETRQTELEEPTEILTVKVAFWKIKPTGLVRTSKCWSDPPQTWGWNRKLEPSR